MKHRHIHRYTGTYKQIHTHLNGHGVQNVIGAGSAVAAICVEPTFATVDFLTAAVAWVEVLRGIRPIARRSKLTCLAAEKAHKTSFQRRPRDQENYEQLLCSLKCIC